MAQASLARRAIEGALRAVKGHHSLLMQSRYEARTLSCIAHMAR
jgi:hypothetical protein